MTLSWACLLLAVLFSALMSSASFASDQSDHDMVMAIIRKKQPYESISVEKLVELTEHYGSRADISQVKLDVAGRAFELLAKYPEEGATTLQLVRMLPKHGGRQRRTLLEVIGQRLKADLYDPDVIEALWQFGRSLRATNSTNYYYFITEFFSVIPLDSTQTEYFFDEELERRKSTDDLALKIWLERSDEVSGLRPRLRVYLEAWGTNPALHRHSWAPVMLMGMAERRPWAVDLARKIFAEARQSESQHVWRNVVKGLSEKIQKLGYLPATVDIESITDTASAHAFIDEHLDDISVPD